MGFSSQWLGLRETADHAARDQDLMSRAAVAAGPRPVILDLGCGTGSTVRALGPFLPADTKWNLVDNDAELLELAGAETGGKASLYCQDLNDLERLPLEGVTLVTASALLDLVSKNWLLELAASLNVPAYFALSYDGQMLWTPKDSRDSAVTEAFNMHQQSNKGFGLALGPKSVEVAKEVFTDAGFSVQWASSPWQLGTKDVALQKSLVQGIALAAEEAGFSEARAWGENRVKEAAHTSCLIGHGDLLAIPVTLSELADDVLS